MELSCKFIYLKEMRKLWPLLKRSRGPASRPRRPLGFATYEYSITKTGREHALILFYSIARTSHVRFQTT